jgi:hypothetical protein
MEGCREWDCCTIRVMKDKHHLRKIFTDAWAYLRSGLFKTFGEALKASWLKSKLILRLHQGLVYLAIRDKRGKARLAIATMKPVHTEDYKIKEGIGSCTNSVMFLDLIKGEFREIRIDKIKTYLNE